MSHDSQAASIALKLCLPPSATGYGFLQQARRPLVDEGRVVVVTGKADCPSKPQGVRHTSLIHHQAHMIGSRLLVSICST